MNTRNMKALCFGSLNIDYVYKVDHFVQKGETLSSDGLLVYTGGKGLNQSIALARAGAPVYHAGAVGTDGRFLLEEMEKAGVCTELVEIRKDIRTGNAIIQNDADGDNCILLYGGANQAISKAQVDRAISCFSEGDCILLQNEINELAYIMEKAHEAKMTIVLNPSPMDGKILKLPLAYVDIFILNEIEAAQMAGSAPNGTDGRIAAKRLLEAYPEAEIVLTLGSEGSLFISKTELIEQPAYKVSAVDTTAAGDTFTGYFIGGLLAGKSHKEAMETAAKASAIAVTRNGAAPSIPTADEVARYFRQ